MRYGSANGSSARTAGPGAPHVREDLAVSDERDATPPPAPSPPDAVEVNAGWPAEPRPRSGWRGWAERRLLRLLGPQLSAQRAFNAAQVRLDNALLKHLAERFEATHRHYDALLGDVGRRQEEADERHRLLEQELLRHVQDLVQRVDLVLVEANRDKHALRQGLEDLRSRLQRLEQALGRRAE